MLAILISEGYYNKIKFIISLIGALFSVITLIASLIKFIVKKLN